MYALFGVDQLNNTDFYRHQTNELLELHIYIFFITWLWDYKINNYLILFINYYFNNNLIDTIIFNCSLISKKTILIIEC